MKGYVREFIVIGAITIMGFWALWLIAVTVAG